jgi:hypothetical protein
MSDHPSRSEALSRKRPGIEEPFEPKHRHQTQRAPDKKRQVICEVQPSTPSAAQGTPMRINELRIPTPMTLDAFLASPMLVDQASPHFRGHMQSPRSSTPLRRGPGLGSPSPSELLEMSRCLFERLVVSRACDDAAPFLPIEFIRRAQRIGKGSFGVVFKIDVSATLGPEGPSPLEGSFAIKACKSAQFGAEECACMVLLTRLSQMTLRSTPTLDRCTWVASERPLCSWIGCMLGEAVIDVPALERSIPGLNPTPEFNKRMKTMVMQTVTSPESPDNLSDRARITRDMGCWISMAANFVLKEREQNVKDIVQMLFATLFASAFCANSAGVRFNDLKVDNVLVELGSGAAVEAVVFDRLDSSRSKRFVYTERVRPRVVDASLFTCHAFARTSRTYEEGRSAGHIADALCMNSFERRSPRPPGCSNISDYICFIKNVHNHVCLSSKIASLVVENRFVESLDKRLNPVIEKLLIDALGSADVLDCGFLDTPNVMFRCSRWFERWSSSAEEGAVCDELEDWLIEVKNARKYWSTGDTFKIGLRTLISSGGLELVMHMKDALFKREIEQIERALGYLRLDDSKGRVEAWKTDKDNNSLWACIRRTGQLASVRVSMLRLMKSDPQLGNAFYVLLPKFTAEGVRDVQNGFVQLYRLASDAKVQEGMFSDVASRVHERIHQFPNLSIKRVVIRRREIVAHSQDLLTKTDVFDAYLQERADGEVETRGILLPAAEQLRRTRDLGVIERTIRERRVVEFDILKMMDDNGCEIAED